MEAVIVAAGRGVRMGSIGSHTPKCLLTVAGTTLLEYELRGLCQVGIRRVSVVLGHLADKVAPLLAKDFGGLAIRTVQNPDYASTGGASSFLLGSAGIDEDLLYLVGDMLSQKALFERIASCTGRVTLGIQRRPTVAEDMKVRLDGQRVIDIGKRMDPRTAHGEFVGAAYLPRTSLPGLRQGFRRVLSSPGKRSYHFGDVMRELLAGGLEVGWVDITDVPWGEIDSPRDLARARLKWKGATDS